MHNVSESNLNITDTSDNDGDLSIFSLYSTTTGKRTKDEGYTVKVLISGVLCDMQIDTAADYSIMSKSVYKENFSNVPLFPSKVKLKTYTGEMLDICGEMSCNVIYENQKIILPIIVANHVNKPTLLGRNWLKKVRLVKSSMLMLNIFKIGLVEQKLM